MNRRSQVYCSGKYKTLIRKRQRKKERKKEMEVPCHDRESFGFQSNSPLTFKKFRGICIGTYIATLVVDVCSQLVSSIEFTEWSLTKGISSNNFQKFLNFSNRLLKRPTSRRSNFTATVYFYCCCCCCCCCCCRLQMKKNEKRKMD